MNKQQSTKCVAQPEQEPVKIAHKHEWFRTGEMKVGQMRCISCGTWGQEDRPPQRTAAKGEDTRKAWDGLTDREKSNLWLESRAAIPRFYTYASLVEAKLREKNSL